MFALLLAAVLRAPDLVSLKPGMTLSRSMRVRPSTYPFPSPHGSTGDVPGPAAIHVRGNNLVIDFHGAVLQGSPTSTLPDQRPGTGLDVTGKNITIKNAVIRGYKIGLLARKAPGLKLIHCDFSYNWKQHLRSTLEREDLSDWQSYHHNEHDEWMRYGAGAYLEDTNSFEVQGCSATGGQCGLLLVRCNYGQIWNNDFSFLSGLGLGMYRSSRNKVMHNKLDWCVRGFSYGVYNRGQDSAGILVFEQCIGNTFAYNSVTHGGDGFFLWAGQQTMDSGKGGCNDNLLYGNDFSHAPANSIEATFSTNKFVHNLCVESDYGVWGGYSYDTTVMDNYIAACRIGAAFEHSQRCDFTLNTFARCKTGIQLWATSPPDPSLGYAKAHETGSADNEITFNHFADVPGAAIYLRGTHKTRLDDNSVIADSKGLDADNTNAPLPLQDLNRVKSDVTTLDWRTDKEYPGDIHELLDGWDPYHSNPFNADRVPPIKGGMSPFLPERALRGRRYILVDEWGPYDFRSPRLWPRGLGAAGQQVLEVLGPVGKWKLIRASGATVIGSQEGEVPGVLSIKLQDGEAQNVSVELEYVGGETTDTFGRSTPAKTPIRFGYSKFFAPIAWTSKFFAWDNSTDPRTHDEAFKALLATSPIATVQSNKLDFSGYGAWAKGVPDNNFAISADGDFSTPGGNFTLDLTCDDGARLYLDDAPVQLYDADGKPASAFHYQGPTAYQGRVTLTKGRHHLHVEYFQIDGYKTLQLTLRPRE